MIDIFLPIKITPKARPRFSNGVVYTPSKTRACENQVAMMVKSYMNLNKIPISFNPVSVSISFGLATKSKNLVSKPHFKRPDIDNLCKTVLDALNGVAINDDGQVSEMVVAKCYAKEDWVKITIKELENVDQPTSPL